VTLAEVANPSTVWAYAYALPSDCIKPLRVLALTTKNRSPSAPEIPTFRESGLPDLKDYDAIIIGAGTRFGSAASQMRAFLDQAGGLWFSGALIGKVGGAFTATATQHGGQETTFQGLHNFFMHHGMPVVGLPYSFQAQMTLDAVHGGSPYGATTITGGDGSRMPSEIELDGARFQGKHIAELAKKLHG
jgi:NAD(P)H dehydrogenase (quinone)